MIDIQGLNFAYNNAPLFTGLALNLQPGNIYGLLGLNGAGKSTLLKLITGLLFPDSGRINCMGHIPARRDADFLADVFVLPEEMNMPNVTDREFIAIRAPFYPRFDHAALAYYQNEMAVPRNCVLRNLSLGQKKKFLLAFGLACNARLLVMDEPTNGLDIPSKGLFRRLVAECAGSDRVVVISTHQVRDVESLIDPLIILHEGRVLLNHALGDIGAGIRIEQSATRPDNATPGLLYAEPAVGGFRAVYADTTGTDAQIDLELLFNAVTARPQSFARQLQRDGEKN
ncbi:MAG: ABC transporter ATP-binding protein [Gammaproteobacteria bacterium]|nr:ABC transporter ATP-binding protein [Gammaproteobacteria bacterium]